MDDDNLSIARRRPRRCSIKIEPHSNTALAPKTPSKTPRKSSKKRVRFSDTGLMNTSGLTPMVNRVSVTTPRQRRHSSAPVVGMASGYLPQSGEVTFLPLRQVLDGRVQRRIRRNGLSEEMNTIQQARKKKAKETEAEVKKLKDEIKVRDKEIEGLQNATMIIDDDRVENLKEQIRDLQDQLREKSSRDKGYNWTLTGGDHFVAVPEDMDLDEEAFGEETMANFDCSTPRRVTSLQTPPATSPLLPGTPRFLATPMPEVRRATAGVQASLVDPNQVRLEEEVASLHREVDKLKTTLDPYKSLGERLSGKLSDFAGTSDFAGEVEKVEACVETLLQTMSDRTCALTQLTTAISSLGFPGTDASDMVTSLTSGFRAARLELEYLTPGEIALSLSSHGAEVLDLLLTRLRSMAKRAKEDEDAIDEYHETEQSLRKLLDARVSVMEDLKAEMGKAEQLMSSKMARIRELEVANQRLKGAVDGYIRDVSELERLVQQMEKDAQDAEDDYGVQLEAKRKVLSKKEDSIADLEKRLADALQRAIGLQKEMAEIQDNKSRDVAALNKDHGDQLAARDVKVSDYRKEIDRVNKALRKAHNRIWKLRVENGGLKVQMDKEKENAKAVMDSMKEELERVVAMSQEFLKKPEGDAKSATRTPQEPVVRHGGYFSAGLARRTSKNRDSGVALEDLEESLS